MTTLKIVRRPGCVKEPQPQIKDLFDAYGMVMFMAKFDRECLYVFHLNAKHQVIGKEMVSMGALSQTTAYPRDVFKGAVLNNSFAIICAHNHPSGDPKPGQEDIATHNYLKNAGALLGIPVLDHIVVGDFNVISIEAYIKAQQVVDISEKRQQRKQKKAA